MRSQKKSETTPQPWHSTFMYSLPELLVMALILTLILLAAYRGWGRGRWPPRGPYSH